MSISLFLPVRKGSERITNKNTRSFGGLKGGLLQFKLDNLIGLVEVDEIVISSNDEKCLEIATSFAGRIPNLKIVERSDALGDTTTPLSDLIKHAGGICEGDHVIWTHVTSPFFTREKYREAINKYAEVKSKGFDSLITCIQVQEYLIDPGTGKMVNKITSEQWPRTQDLQKLFQINNAVFLAEKAKYKDGKRIGNNPFYMQVDKLASLDVDWEEDFKIAEAIYEGIFK